MNDESSRYYRAWSTACHDSKLGIFGVRKFLDASPSKIESPLSAIHGRLAVGILGSPAHRKGLYPGADGRASFGGGTYDCACPSG